MDTLLFDVALPPVANRYASTLDYRLYSPSANLLLAGDAATCYVIAPADGAAQVIDLASSDHAGTPVIDGDDMYVADRRLAKYRLRPFSGAPVAKSDWLYESLGPVESSPPAVFHAADGRTRVYLAADIGAGYTILAFDESLRTIARARTDSVNPTFLAVFADGHGEPVVVFGNDMHGITALDGHTLQPSPYRPAADVVPDGDMSRFQASRADQRWCYVTPDGMLPTARHLISRADSGTTSRIAFLSNDFYACRNTLRVISFDAAVPSFVNLTLQNPPAGSVTTATVSLASRPGDMRLVSCAPYILPRDGGLCALVVLADPRRPVFRCQAWGLPPATPSPEWRGYWDAEWRARAEAHGFAGPYVERIGDDDWKMYRLASFWLDNTVWHSPPPLLMTL